MLADDFFALPQVVISKTKKKKIMKGALYVIIGTAYFS